MGLLSPGESAELQDPERGIHSAGQSTLLKAQYRSSAFFYRSVLGNEVRVWAARA